VNDGAARLAIRARLIKQVLPSNAPWRCLGEYAGGGLCDGCGERITSAQASYAVDFIRDAAVPSGRLHRACFEIWQQESLASPGSSAALIISTPDPGAGTR
jgi:hypothetical protein